ncbi:MAG TPA: exosortase-associated EpsI family protein [Gemmataceae bacterium]|nr:exosortase-associated EpsI family protein [Gemmataceae bacterium]
MVRLIPTASAVVLVIGLGIVHGLWTDRWVHSEEPGRAAARLASISLTLGEWQGRRLQLDERQLGGISGYFYGRYVHSRTGKSISAFLVAGRPGPVAEHTPDVCYQASGYEVGTAHHFSLGKDEHSPHAEFWTSLLKKTKAADQIRLRIYWAWSFNGDWSAPENPRWTFAGRSVLYKLYVIREIQAGEDSREDAACSDFLKEFLPEFQKTQFAD